MKRATCDHRHCRDQPPTPRPLRASQVKLPAIRRPVPHAPYVHRFRGRQPSGVPSRMRGKQERAADVASIASLLDPLVAPLLLPAPIDAVMLGHHLVPLFTLPGG
jgi:hypothetical protein